jgi:hypothetical protein
MTERADRPHRFRRTLVALSILVWITSAVGTHVPLDHSPGGLFSAGRILHPLARLARMCLSFVSDKVIHAAAYFLLGGLLWLTLRAFGARLGRRAAAVLLVAACWGAIDELTQPLVGRSPELLDWAADVAGAVAAVCLCTAVALLVRAVRTLTARKPAAGPRPPGAGETARTDPPRKQRGL